MKAKDRERISIGWREWLALPELGLLAICAKVDTGAETSSLHARSISSFRKEGADWVRFTTAPVRGANVSCEAPVHAVREVVSSNGHAEERIVIRSMLRFGVDVAASEWPVEITLADRRSMQFSMLLGREAIAGRAVVDAGASFLLGEVEADPNDFYT